MIRTATVALSLMLASSFVFADELDALRLAAEQVPKDRRARTTLARALGAAGEHRESMEQWLAAAELGAAIAGTHFHAAEQALELGEHRRALELLASSIDAGLPPGNLAPPAFAGLREDPGFLELVERAERLAAPCLHSTEHAGLDFWIGDWTLSTPKGRPLGESRVDRVDKGCVLIETWRSAVDSGGRATNHWDPELKVWRHRWLDDSGNIVDATGRLTDQGVAFEGRSMTQDGASTPYRMTLEQIEDGRLRQVIDLQLDETSSWTTVLETVYGPSSSTD